MAFMVKTMVGGQLKNLTGSLGGGEDKGDVDKSAAEAQGMSREEYEEYQKQLVEEKRGKRCGMCLLGCPQSHPISHPRPHPSFAFKPRGNGGRGDRGLGRGRGTCISDETSNPLIRSGPSRLCLPTGAPLSLRF
ncbi:PREDICTED: complexin-3 isoform X2 [Ceratotherium simum simum]|uniref:Complexin-3 isoform X2 n=1 Tax=Ceratotherium simum simum TaxID=73337 RepID=A0ABM1CA33_CERSS|nr:PREDICTED: complexin-3 isoform X2 [Ceratotherium simum simum]